MYDITFDARAVNKMLARFGSDAMGKRTRAAMNESLAYMQGQVQEGTPVGVAGNLRGSIITDIRGHSVDLSGKVFSPLPYARYVEFGRRPGKFPPRGPIELWARRKLGDASLWFVVARAIARRGTKGHFMFRNAWRSGKGNVELIFRRHIMGR